VISGYLSSLPYLRQLSSYHLDQLENFALRAPPSFGTPFLEDVKQDTLFDDAARIGKENHIICCKCALTAKRTGQPRLDMFSSHSTPNVFATTMAALTPDVATAQTVGLLQCAPVKRRRGR
jgi:hypothetical protein